MPTLERLVPADADSLAALGELASASSRPDPAPGRVDDQVTVAVPRASATRGRWPTTTAALRASVPVLRSPTTVPAVAAVRDLPVRTRVLALGACSVAAGLLAGLVVPVASAAPAATARAVTASGAPAAVVAPGSTAKPSRTTQTAKARTAVAATKPAAKPATTPPPARTATQAALTTALPALAGAAAVDWAAASRPSSAVRAVRATVPVRVPLREAAPTRPSLAAIAAARAYKPTRPVPAESGTGRRIVYSQHRGHLWVVDADGRVLRDYPVTGRIGRPSPGTYRVFSKSRTAVNPTAKVRFDLMVRFAHGITGAPIGFHTIPRWYDGRPLQRVSQLGQMIGAGGCVRQSTADARWLYRWAAVGEQVVVLR